jgi:hypothetical protein
MRCKSHRVRTNSPAPPRCRGLSSAPNGSGSRLEVRRGTAALIRPSLVTLVWIAAAGCGDATAARDGGAPTDGTTVVPPDARTPACIGSLGDCTSMTIETCEAVPGCIVTACVGFPVACDRREEDECTAELGCAWDGSACTGMASPCALFTPCTRQPGCATGGSASCRGSATACSALPIDECEAHPGCGLDPCSPKSGVAAFELRVVAGPGAATPLEAALVRAETACSGDVVEVETAADGTARLELDRARGTWNLTVAKRGHTAVSIVAVSDFALDGDIRLDRLDAGAQQTVHSISGYVTGATATVEIAGFDVEGASIMPGGGWGGRYVAGPHNAGLPVRVLAIARDARGLPTNVAVAEVPRTASEIVGVELAFPDPPVPVTETVFHTVLDPTSFVGAPNLVYNSEGYAFQWAGAFDGQEIVSGDSFAEILGSELIVTARHFAAPGQSDVVGAVFGQDSTMTRLVVHHHFSGPDPIVVGGGTFSTEGTTLGDFTVHSQGLAGHDALEIQLERGESVAAWRIFAPTLPPIVTVPHLPSGLTLADIGVIGETTAFVRLTKMAVGRPWSAPSLPSASAHTSYVIGQTQIPLSSAGR